MTDSNGTPLSGDPTVERKLDAGGLPEAPDRPRRSVHEIKGPGGTFTHSPECRCRPCSARRRKQKALAIATGVGGPDLDAAFPEKTVTDKRGHSRAAPRSLRDRIAQYLHFALLFPNSTKSDIASKMGLSNSTLYELLRQGQEHGLLKFTDPLEMIEYQIIPKIVNNLNYYLDQKDKTVTIEAAKGTLFPAYKESRGIQEGSQTVLALKIEPAGDSGIKVLAGHIVGRPKGLPEDDEVLDG